MIVYRMYVVFYVVFNHFTEKICPWHFCRWAGHCAHSRKKKISFSYQLFRKKFHFRCLFSFWKRPSFAIRGRANPAWKVSVWSFSAPYFPAFRMNMENYWLSYSVQIPENTEQKNYYYGKKILKLLKLPTPFMKWKICSN